MRQLILVPTFEVNKPWMPFYLQLNDLNKQKYLYNLTFNAKNCCSITVKLLLIEIE